MANKLGDGYFQLDPENDEAIKARYRQSIIEALTVFEGAIKLTVKAHDVTGLQSIQNEVRQIIERAEATLKQGTGGHEG